MFNRITFLFFIIIIWTCFRNSSDAQTLIKTNTFYGNAEMQSARRQLGASLVNKPNGAEERVRIQQDYPALHRPSHLADWEAPISEATEDGYLMLLHREENSFSHQYWCLLYDKDKNMTEAIDLCAIAGQRDCEVADVRYDHKQLFWNFSCITYASRLENKCNQLFCYDLQEKTLRWKSDYLSSRDIFTLDDRYVYSGYGFTNEPDFVYLIDRNDGKTLSQCPVASAPQYMQLTNDGLFVEDYRKNGYLFRVTEEAAVRITGDNVRLREGPSTQDAIYSHNGQDATYPLKGDLVESCGQVGDFNAVRINGKKLYISKRFSTINVVRRLNTADLKSAGMRAWTEGKGKNYVCFNIYDMKSFVDAVELMENEQNDLVANTTYKVYTEGAKVNGVFLSPCAEYGAVLFILTEDNRLFALDMLEATADDGTPLRAIDLAIGNFPLTMLESEKSNDNWAVWATDVNDRRRKVSVANLDY